MIAEANPRVISLKATEIADTRMTAGSCDNDNSPRSKASSSENVASELRRDEEEVIDL